MVIKVADRKLITNYKMFLITNNNFYWILLIMYSSHINAGYKNISNVLFDTQKPI